MIHPRCAWKTENMCWVAVCSAGRCADSSGAAAGAEAALLCLSQNQVDLRFLFLYLNKEVAGSDIGEINGLLSFQLPFRC